MIARRFSVAAKTYDRYATLQRAVARRLIQGLDPQAQPSCILEIGCGTGLLTQRLRRRYPAAWIDAFDASPAMLSAARARLGDDRYVRWHLADASTFHPRDHYDLVASSCVLHWIDPLDAVLVRAAGWMAPGGRLAAAVMVNGTLAELRAARARAAPDKPPGAFPKPVDLRRALMMTGLRSTRLRVETIRCILPSAADVVHRLHAQGLTAGPLAGSGRPLTRGELHRLIAEYDRCSTTARGVRATYCTAFLEGIQPGSTTA